MLALAQLTPGMVERLAPRFGVTQIFERVARQRGRAGE
jgi:hypothetical protein